VEVLLETATKAKQLVVKATFNINLANWYDSVDDPGADRSKVDTGLEPVDGFEVPPREWERLKPSIHEAASQILASLDLMLPPGSTVDLGQIQVTFEDSE
jgi:hypothetical protein